MRATNDTIGEASSWLHFIAVYGAFVLAAIVLTGPTFWDMARTWLSSSSYHHGLFVAPAAIWMIVSHSARPQEPGGHRAAVAAVAVGVMVWLAGRAGGAAIIEQIGLVAMLIGGVGAVFGDRALVLWAWPLAFLYFMVPFGESIVPMLQAITAAAAVALLNIAGADIVIDGLLIHTRVGAFAIAEACAGLRLLTAALMVSAVFAYVAFESWTRRIAFLLFAAVFALIANGVRAFLLILIPVATGRPASLGPDHFIVGWLFYLVVLVILALIGRRFADRRIAAHTEASAPPLRLVAVFAALAVIAAGVLYARLVVDRPIDRQAPASIALLQAEGWRVLPAPENWRAVAPGADQTSAATYDRDGVRVYASIAYFTHDRSGAEIGGGENRSYDGQDWRRIGGHDAALYLFGSSETRRFNRLAGPDRRRLLTVTFYWLGDTVYDSAQAVKQAQMRNRLLGRNPSGGVIVFSASYRRDPNDAIAILRQYTADVEEFSAWRGRLEAL